MPDLEKIFANRNPLKNIVLRSWQTQLFKDFLKFGGQDHQEGVVNDPSNRDHDSRINVNLSADSEVSHTILVVLDGVGKAKGIVFYAAVKICLDDLVLVLVLVVHVANPIVLQTAYEDAVKVLLPLALLLPVRLRMALFVFVSVAPMANNVNANAIGGF